MLAGRPVCHARHQMRLFRFSHLQELLTGLEPCCGEVYIEPILVLKLRRLALRGS
jgi:hypothetical protein